MIKTNVFLLHFTNYIIIADVGTVISLLLNSEYYYNHVTMH